MTNTGGKQSYQIGIIKCKKNYELLCCTMNNIVIHVDSLTSVLFPSF